jgi:nucleoside-diphosphate-sugar epimerase
MSPSTVFVTGATGVLGRATVPLLVAGGHRVRALSRSPEHDDPVRALGAEPVRADLFDPASLRGATAGADAVLHLATSIPIDGRRRAAWYANDRVRAVGARNLVDAAIANGIATVVYPSFAMVYPDSGDAWIDAASTPAAPAPILTSTLEAEAEIARFAASGSGRRGVSLRLGRLYGPGLPSTEGMLAAARRGLAPAFGPAAAYTPMLWIDDAASALVAALERAPSGVYDVVDDRPLTRGETVAALARVVGRRHLLLPPRWLAAFAVGPAAPAFADSQRVSNRRFKEVTGWAPAVPDARAGFAHLTGVTGTVAAAPVAAPSRRAAALLLGGLAAFLLSAGAWELFAPAHFYDSFPGFGRAWVSVDGPYNEHLVRDFGGANLALGLMGLALLLRPTVWSVRAFAASVLVAQTAHFVYHAARIDLLPTASDRVLQTVSLAVVAILPALLVPLAAAFADGGAAAPAPRQRQSASALVRQSPTGAD